MTKKVYFFDAIGDGGRRGGHFNCPQRPFRVGQIIFFPGATFINYFIGKEKLDDYIMFLHDEAYRDKRFPLPKWQPSR